MSQHVAEYAHSGFQFLAHVSFICFSMFYFFGISTVTRCKTFCIIHSPVLDLDLFLFR